MAPVFLAVRIHICCYQMKDTGKQFDPAADLGETKVEMRSGGVTTVRLKRGY